MQSPRLGALCFLRAAQRILPIRTPTAGRVRSRDDWDRSDWRCHNASTHEARCCWAGTYSFEWRRVRCAPPDAEAYRVHGLQRHARAATPRPGVDDPPAYCRGSGIPNASWMGLPDGHPPGIAICHKPGSEGHQSACVHRAERSGRAQRGRRLDKLAVPVFTTVFPPILAAIMPGTGRQQHDKTYQSQSFHDISFHQVKNNGIPGRPQGARQSCKHHLCPDTADCLQGKRRIEAMRPAIPPFVTTRHPVSANTRRHRTPLRPVARSCDPARGGSVPRVENQTGHSGCPGGPLQTARESISESWARPATAEFPDCHRPGPATHTAH